MSRVHPADDVVVGSPSTDVYTNEARQSTFKTIERPMNAPKNSKHVRGVRLSYPYYDMFVYSVGSSNETLCGLLFGKILAEKLYYWVRYRHGNRIILYAMMTQYLYVVSVQLNILPFIRWLYITLLVSSSLLLLITMLLFNTEVMKRLSWRFEVQFSTVNTLFVIVGMVLSFDDTLIAFSHALIALVGGITVTFLDASVERKKLILFNSMAAVMFLSFLILINGSGNTHIKLSASYYTAEYNLGNIAGKKIAMRSMANVMWLCVARIVILLRYPSSYVSLKGPMVAIKPTKAVYDMLMVLPVYEDLVAKFKLSEHVSNRERNRMVVMNIKKPFSHQVRDVIGLRILGQRLADRYFYVTIHRLYFAAFIILVAPIFVHMQLIVTQDNRDLGTLDYIILCIICTFTAFTFLFTNWKLLKSCWQSLELVVFAVSVLAMSIILIFISWGTHKVSFGIYYLLTSVLVTAIDAHSHRFIFSLLFSVTAISITVMLYVWVTLDFLDFKNRTLDLPGFEPIDLKGYFLGFTENILILLLRNIILLAKYPSCYLFLKSPMQSLKVTEDTGVALKATSTKYVSRCRSTIMLEATKPNDADPSSLETIEEH